MLTLFLAHLNHLNTVGTIYSTYFTIKHFGIFQIERIYAFCTIFGMNSNFSSLNRINNFVLIKKTQCGKVGTDKYYSEESHASAG
jgi:hypothetical protein